MIALAGCSLLAALLAFHVAPDKSSAATSLLLNRRAPCSVEQTHTHQAIICQWSARGATGLSIVNPIEMNPIAPVHANHRSSVETLPLGVIADRQRDPRDIVAYAHARGVIAEAELGTLGGIEDVAEKSLRSMLTDPAHAQCRRRLPTCRQAPTCRRDGSASRAPR
jgi:hypothetical protein